MMLKNEYEKGSKGFLYYAHNNDVINYLRLAICSAITGKYQIPTFRAMVVTDDESLSSLDARDRMLLDKLFEEIKIDNDFKTDNKRLTVTSDTTRDIHSWHNGTRPNAFDNSIYDETIMVDVDFLFQDINLNKLWGSNSPILMNKDILPIVNNRDSVQFGFLSHEMVGNYTIPMYWATVVYFNRSELSKEFFDLVNHIKDNYFYYQRLYQVEDRAYRNDYSFSIALYMITGYATPGVEWEIPYKFVLSRPRDVVYKIDKGQTKMIINTGRRTSPSHLFNVQKTSLHCMNKIGLQSKYQELLGVYGYE